MRTELDRERDVVVRAIGVSRLPEMRVLRSRGNRCFLGESIPDILAATKLNGVVDMPLGECLEAFSSGRCSEMSA